MKKQSEFSIINVHAPHIGLTSSQEKVSQTDNFHNDLQNTIINFHGMDLIIIGNLNAKFGKKDSEDLAVGSHARGW